jgi:hypothetical protein
LRIAIVEHKRLKLLSAFLLVSIPFFAQGKMENWRTYRNEKGNFKVNHSGNLYTGKHYAYTVMAIYPAGADPLGVLRFTDSFSLVDRSK